jgi:ubiquinone/menaquinone biosynthesis C-methylase UbiE
MVHFIFFTIPSNLKKEVMVNLYGNKWIGYGYDLLASLVWLPSKHKLYNNAIVLLDLKANETVLELGCGTGFLTKKLLEKQSSVTAVDQSTGMLARAKGRAPQAQFLQADIVQYTDTKRYDYVMMFFVLHELNAAQRISMLKSASSFLSKNGKIIICDFAIPGRGFMKVIFPRLLSLWEPKSIVDFLTNGLTDEIVNSGLKIVSYTKLHSGRVQLMKLQTS